MLRRLAIAVALALVGTGVAIAVGALLSPAPTPDAAVLRHTGPDARQRADLGALREQAGLDPERHVLPRAGALEVNQVRPLLSSPNPEERRLAALFLVNRGVHVPIDLVRELSASADSGDRLVGYYARMRLGGGQEEAVWKHLEEESDPHILREMLEECLLRRAYKSDERVLRLLARVLRLATDVNARMHLLSIAHRLLPEHVAQEYPSEDPAVRVSEVLELIDSHTWDWDAQARSFR